MLLIRLNRSAVNTEGNLGFTMIELLIALVISSIGLAFVYQTFTMQYTSFKDRDEVSIRNQYLQMAIEVLSSDIQMAGYGSAGLIAGYSSVTKMRNPNNTQASGRILNVLTSWNGADFDTPLKKKGTDAITIIYGDETVNGYLIDSISTPPSAGQTLKVESAIAKAASGTDLQYLCTHRRADNVTPVGASMLLLAGLANTHGLPSAALLPIVGPPSGPHPGTNAYDIQIANHESASYSTAGWPASGYAVQSQVMCAVYRTYFIDRCDNLRLIANKPLTANVSLDADTHIIAPQIEDMQIAYFLSNNASTPNIWTHEVDPADGPEIRKVRMSLLARTKRRDQSSTKSVPGGKYTPLEDSNISDASTKTQYIQQCNPSNHSMDVRRDNRYPRRWLTTVLQVRNLRLLDSLTPSETIARP